MTATRRETCPECDGDGFHEVQAGSVGGPRLGWEPRLVRAECRPCGGSGWIELTEEIGVFFDRIDRRLAELDARLDRMLAEAREMRTRLDEHAETMRRLLAASVGGGS